MGCMMQVGKSGRVDACTLSLMFVLVFFRLSVQSVESTRTTVTISLCGCVKFAVRIER